MEIMMECNITESDWSGLCSPFSPVLLFQIIDE